MGTLKLPITILQQIAICFSFLYVCLKADHGCNLPLTCGENMCDMGGSPDSIVLQYVGGDVLSSTVSLTGGISVTGSLVNSQTTRIRIIGDGGLLGIGAPVYFDQTVSLGQIFSVNASTVGRNTLPSVLHISFINILVITLQSIDIIPDCTDSLVMGDQYGAIKVVAIRTKGVCYPYGNECTQNPPPPSDLCPQDPLKTTPGQCGCGVADTDSDNDGTPDCNDACPNDPSKNILYGCPCGQTCNPISYSVNIAHGDQCDNTLLGLPILTISPLLNLDLGLGTVNFIPCEFTLTEYLTNGTARLTGTFRDNVPVIIWHANITLTGYTTVPPVNNPKKDLLSSCYPNITTTAWRYYRNIQGTLTADVASVLAGAVLGVTNSTRYSPQIGVGANNRNTHLGFASAFTWNVISQPIDLLRQLASIATQGDFRLDINDRCNGSAPVDGNGQTPIVTIDLCPNDGFKLIPGICGCGVSELDTDSDGTPDCIDQCPNNPQKIAPLFCGCNNNGDGDDSDHDGYPDCIDNCPNDPLKVQPGVCGCGIADTDSDLDGTPDCDDGCPSNPLKTDPGQCGCFILDIDVDGDGVASCLDLCPLDILKTFPGQCGCGLLETDTDNDDVPDCLDLCDNDPFKTLSVGLCGCGVSEIDTDGDGTPDCIDFCPDDPFKIIPGLCGCGDLEILNCGDNCPLDPLKSGPGQCGCGIPDTDLDLDGVADCIDGCPLNPNLTHPNVCGCVFPLIDTDNDQYPDCIDLCPLDPNRYAPGMCGCGMSDADTDSDGTPDCLDACPLDPLKISLGSCGCLLPETDTDSDGIPDCIDLCPNDYNKIIPGVCGCGYSDIDTDGDLVPDCLDPCLLDPLKVLEGLCGCGNLDVDTDGDQIPDCIDLCPGDSMKILPGICGCGIPDSDQDHDLIVDCQDGCPTDPLKIQPGVCGCTYTDFDSDLDGTPDCNDGCPYDIFKTSPGVCDCGVADIDTDLDGTFDCFDTCPNDSDKTTPGQCGCDNLDVDTDYDGHADCVDACPYDPLKYTPGQCGCGILDTVLNCGDDCPNDPTKSHPGICGCGVPDTDSDHDLVADCLDGCPYDPYKTYPGRCGCGETEIDSDLDGTPNCIDGCPFDILKISAGQCGCGVLDVDTDYDGVVDCLDGCPLNPLKVTPGTCGCLLSEQDSDGDGVPDCRDYCPNNAIKTEPGLCGCLVSDVDNDGDNVPDCLDACPNDSNKVLPGLCGCSENDNDYDEDLIPDCNDGCPSDPFKVSPGQCGCGTPDTDIDYDGYANCIDICPLDPLKHSSAGQCGCGQLETDTDEDGYANCIDVCPLDSHKNTTFGICGCGVSDIDTDGDGVANCLDVCPNNPTKTSPLLCGCSQSDEDSDGDGVPDCIDGCELDPYKTVSGVCGCGQTDLDLNDNGIIDCLEACNPILDTDEDGVNDCEDACPYDSYKIEPLVCGCGLSEHDSDYDGVPDCVDSCPLDPFKSHPGICGCENLDIDSDSDGCADCADACPEDVNKCASTGICGCGVPDADLNNDYIIDCIDLCPLDPLKSSPGECGCGIPDTDQDHDGTPDCHDLCNIDPEKTYPGLCGCGHSDTQDSDLDDVPDCVDACPLDPGKIFPGICGCGMGDTDQDNDGVYDCIDMCPGDPYKITPERCGCDISEIDSDNDGTPDCIDECPYDRFKIHPGYCGCNYVDTEECCSCEGLKSITLRYHCSQSIGNHPIVDIAISGVSNAQPLGFVSLECEDYFTVFGTYGYDNILGPNAIQVQIYDHGSIIPFHTQWIDVTCYGARGDGSYVSPYLFVHKRIPNLEGPGCPISCNYTLALSIDVSNDTVNNPRYDTELSLLKHVLEYNVLQKLAGDNVWIAIYQFVDISTEIQVYQDISTFAGVVQIYNAINSLTLIDNSNIVWSDNLLQISTSRPIQGGPDIAVVFAANPLTENIGLASSASLILKNSGETGVLFVDITGDGSIDVFDLQSVSGPFYGIDYYILGNGYDIWEIAVLLTSKTCCPEFRDYCGICHGDSTLCMDCLGTPGGNAHYDRCGICNGDGSTCGDVSCNQNATITVNDGTSLQIYGYDEDGGFFEFVFNTTFQPGTGVVVGFSPYEECSLRQRGTCDNRNSSVWTPFDYQYNDPFAEWCGIFDLDYPSIWEHEIDETTMTVVYKKNFTLYDLLNCRDSQGHGPLINTIVPWKDYTGVLYGNVIRPQNCSIALPEDDDEHYIYDDDDGQSNCELSTISTFYDFELFVSNSGILSSAVKRRSLGFHGKWIRNIWLLSGDVQVEFSTFFDFGVDVGAKLCNATMFRGQETGIPYHLVSDTDCLPSDDFDDADHICKQLWQIRTYDAHGIMDFSGIKPIQFTICGGLNDGEQLTLNLNLTIHRGPDPVTATIRYYAWLGFYRDPARTVLIHDSDSFVDCSFVYAYTRLENHNHHPLFIDKVIICAGTTGDPLPFDSDNPATTGCNTPDIGIQIFTLYQRDPEYVNEFFAFSFEYPSGSHIWESYWKFEAKAVSTGVQIVEVFWSSDSEADQSAGFAGLSNRLSFVPKQYRSAFYSGLNDVQELRSNWWDNIHSSPKRRSDDDDDDTSSQSSSLSPNHSDKLSLTSESSMSIWGDILSFVSSSSSSSSSSEFITIRGHDSKTTRYSKHNLPPFDGDDDDDSVSHHDSRMIPPPIRDDDDSNFDTNSEDRHSHEFSHQEDDLIPMNNGKSSKKHWYDSILKLRNVGKSLRVVCPDDKVWLEYFGTCVDKSHQNSLYYSTHLWLLVVLTPIFVCAILAILAACKREHVHNTVRYTTVYPESVVPPPPTTIYHSTIIRSSTKHYEY